MKATKLMALAIAGLTFGAAQAAPANAVGEKTYTATCASCHASGVLNAPKPGDKAAWAARLKQGKETLYKHGLEGFKMMPAKGGNPALKDADVKAAIDYMISK